MLPFVYCLLALTKENSSEYIDDDLAKNKVNSDACQFFSMSSWSKITHIDLSIVYPMGRRQSD